MDDASDTEGGGASGGAVHALSCLQIAREAVSCHVGALPIPYRTTAEEPTFFTRSDARASVPSPHGRTFPTASDPLLANRYEIGAVGRTTEASRFSERMENHFMYGSKERLPEHIIGLGSRA